jgi:hypothetical protein
MGRLSSDLRSGSFWAIAVAVALGYGVFQLASTIIGYVFYPLVYRLIDVDLNTIPIHLAESNRFDQSSYLDSILLGPILRVVLSGLLTLIVLAQAYLWSLTAASADSVECPYCLSVIPVEASRCAYCGADQPELDDADVDTP